MTSVRRVRRFGVPILALVAAGGTILITQDAGQASTPTRVVTEATAGTSAEAFTACVRAHGVPNFPGVTISSDGKVTLKSGDVGLFSDAYRSAAKACAALLPAGSNLPNPPALPAPSISLGGDCTAVVRPAAPTT